MSGEYDTGTGWWYTDENSHGTHVAGTIVAINNSGTGVVGVNAGRKLKLHIVKVFGAAGANVISMSLGGGRPSATEERAFDELAARGVLSIAAAGNAGNTANSYPAGYASVMMVGALDENKAWASFSQYNSKVELSAPGISVLSTVPAAGGATAALTVGASVHTAGVMEGSPVKSATAPLADFGLGDRTSSAVAGKVCLIARGSIDFATKVRNCQNSGGVGAVIYNNVAGSFSGTLNGAVTTIPSVTVSNTAGAALKGQLGQSATVAVKRNAYAYFNGTSMATPHVSGVAALVWSYFPGCTGNQIRSALDLGSAGRDTRYGFGLVQARSAYERIRTLGCGN